MENFDITNSILSNAQRNLLKIGEHIQYDFEVTEAAQQYLNEYKSIITQQLVEHVHDIEEGIAEAEGLRHMALWVYETATFVADELERQQELSAPKFDFVKPRILAKANQRNPD